MPVHCKYTHFLPHRPCQFDSDWLFVEHVHFCSCQMSCPSCFSGTSGPCCHMFFFFFFTWLMKGRNSVVCVHVGLCGWLVHSLAKAAAILCMLLLLFQAQFLEVLTLCCECSLVIWSSKVQLGGCREDSAHYISLTVAVQQQDLVYFTATTSTTARACVWVGELFHAEGMHKKARVLWYWSMVFLHCSVSSRVPIVTANAGACSWTGLDRSRRAFCYKSFL